MRKFFQSRCASAKLREQMSANRSNNPADCGGRGWRRADSTKLSGTLVTEPVAKLTRLSPMAIEFDSSASLPTKVFAPTKLRETIAPDSIKDPSSTIVIGPTVAPTPTYTFLPSQHGGCSIASPDTRARNSA